MSKVIEFQRKSLSTIVEEIEERGSKAMGVVAIIYDHNGAGHFRISGFDNDHAKFLLLGLLDWIKADLLADVLNITKPL